MRPILGKVGKAQPPVCEKADALVQAARTEFVRYGFDGTDVSRISRRANVGPTTFYRCFKDRVDIFIAVYRRWVLEEREAFRCCLARDAPVDSLVSACVDLYSSELPFRRSVRRLGYDEPRFGRVLAECRRETISELRASNNRSKATNGSEDEVWLASVFIQLEHLASTLSEGELVQMGLSDEIARQRLAAMLDECRTGSPAVSAWRS